MLTGEDTTNTRSRLTPSARRMFPLLPSGSEATINRKTRKGTKMHIPTKLRLKGRQTKLWFSNTHGHIYRWVRGIPTGSCWVNASSYRRSRTCAAIQLTLRSSRIALYSSRARLYASLRIERRSIASTTDSPTGLCDNISPSLRVAEFPVFPRVNETLCGDVNFDRRMPTLFSFWLLSYTNIEIDTETVSNVSEGV